MEGGVGVQECLAVVRLRGCGQRAAQLDQSGDLIVGHVDGGETRRGRLDPTPHLQQFDHLIAITRRGPPPDDRRVEQCPRARMVDLRAHLGSCTHQSQRLERTEGFPDHGSRDAEALAQPLHVQGVVLAQGACDDLGPDHVKDGGVQRQPRGGIRTYLAVIAGRS